MARQFGIITTTTGITSIVVTSFSESQKVDVAEARDSHGKITDLKAYSKGTTITVKGLLDAAACSVTAGSVLTLNSVSYIVESVTVSEKSTGYAEVDITARTADSATPEAYSAT